MENTSNQDKHPRSRRKFFIWIGQVVAGASLAAIGLGLADPQKVLADPDCTPCEGCVVVSCLPNGYCKAHNPEYPNLITYKLKQGCVQTGCYNSQADYYECSNNCTCTY